MNAYIHRAVRSEEVADALKTFVPDPMQRRRMSRIVRDGVTAAAACSAGYAVDAILTATAYGCLADSEKFLRTLLESDEQLLPPSAFIQSTFNTVGATVAQLQGRHCYNTTYAHGAGSFGSAMLDALLLLDAREARNVLVGAAEEVTPTLRTLLARLRVREIPERGGACFFLLSSERQGACARLRTLAVGGALPDAYAPPLDPALRLCRAVQERRDGKVDLGNLQLDMTCL